MNDSKRERELQQLFQAARERDRQKTPSFNRTWRLATSNLAVTRRPRLSLRFAFAVILVFTIFGSIIYFQRPFEIKTARNLSEWRSPTIALLQFPGPYLEQINSTEQLSAASIGSVSRPPVTQTPRTYFLKFPN